MSGDAKSVTGLTLLLSIGALIASVSILIVSCFLPQLTHLLSSPSASYVLSAQVADFTGFVYISAFNDVGEAILGHSATEMERLRMEDEPAFSVIIEKAMGVTWNFAIRAKSEVYNDQQKIRYQANKATP